MRELMPVPQVRTRAVLDRDGNYRLEEEPLPRPGPGEMLFRLLAAGLGPEDAAAGLYVNRTPPTVPVGEIAAVGEGVSGWNPLDAGMVLPHAAGPALPPFAGLADYFLVPRELVEHDLVLKLPAEILPESATLVPATALASKVLREARAGKAASILVVGLGLPGQIAIRLARHQGVRRVFAADASPTLRQRAQWSGATQVIRVPESSVREAIAGETGGRGVDAALVLTSDASQAPDVFQVLAPRGVMVLGAPFSPSFLFALPGARLQRNELRIQGVGNFEARDVRDAFRAMNQGIVNAETLVSKRVAWEELPEAGIEPDYWTHGTHVVVTGPVEESGFGET
jgi:L-iditol 2-dehydrogenase